MGIIPMPFYQSGEVRYFTFALMEDEGVKHAIFTRRGGYSPVPWSSLNMGGTVGDDPQRVRANHELAFSVLGLDLRNKFDVWQVHGSEVVCTSSPRPPDTFPQKGDAIFTDQPGVVLFMRFADCVPVLLYDAKRHVIGIVHAGWMGTVQRVVRKALTVMQRQYGSTPKDVLAGIGPAIGADHYEVGNEVVEQLKRSFGDDAERFINHEKRANGENGIKLDLWQATVFQLKEAGVAQIELANLCTACHVEDWYSHRAENGKTGRFGALITL